MIRSAASKVMWIGRATVFLVGLAVILALVFGVASMAVGANGGNFILGQLNKATSTTQLNGNVSGKAALVVANNNSGGASRALQLNVAQGKAPMQVNAAAGKATNLNADKVDGRDAPLWAVINADGTKARGAGVVSSANQVHLGSSAGTYKVVFNRDVSNCAYIATLGGARLPVEKGEIVATWSGPTNPNAVSVITSDSAGNAEPARAFSLAVLC